jgi:hypothetical protein
MAVCIFHPDSKFVAASISDRKPGRPLCLPSWVWGIFHCKQKLNASYAIRPLLLIRNDPLQCSLVRFVLGAHHECSSAAFLLIARPSPAHCKELDILHVNSGLINTFQI